MQLLVMQFSPPSRHSIPLWSKYARKINVTLTLTSAGKASWPSGEALVAEELEEAVLGQPQLLWLWPGDSSGTQEEDRPPLEACTRALMKDSRAGRLSGCYCELERALQSINCK
jgi:hypothetical protein